MKVLATVRAISTMAILVAIFAASYASAEQPLPEPAAPNELGIQVELDVPLLQTLPYLGRFFGQTEAEAPLPTPPSPSPTSSVSDELIPGEPAEVILELRQKLGGSPLQGTQFDEDAEAPHSPNGEKVIVESIRALEKEDQLRAVQAPEVQARCSACASISAVELPDAELEKRATALRKAGRACEEAADELEAAYLFDRADHLREVAATLRQQSREYLGHPTQNQTGYVPSAHVESATWTYAFPARIQTGHTAVSQPEQFIVRGIDMGSHGYLGVVVAPDEPDASSRNSKLMSDICQLRAELRRARLALERHSPRATRNAGSGKTGLPVR